MGLFTRAEDVTRDTDPRSDERLMQAFASGDAAAFDALYARHRAWLYNTLCRQLQDRARADDVFQETWFSLIRSAPRYEAKAKFSSWLYLLARQRLVDSWRLSNADAAALADSSDNPFDERSAFNADENESSSSELLAALPDERADPMRLAERNQALARLEQALQQLPALQREALLLAEYSEMSLEEIASATGSSRETVKSRLRYARGKLQQLLAQEFK